MIERTATYKNLTMRDQTAWMEPWCEEIIIPAGQTFTFKGRGTDDGEIEIEKRDEGIIVYGWPTSVLSVECDGQIFWKAYFEVPPIPQGMTIRDFAKVMFHQNRFDDQSES
jgi:hypothetical protein